MVRTKKQVNKEEVKAETVVVTRAEKKDATKNLIKEVLAIKPMKHNELIDATAKLYSERFGADTDNVNDVKGRVGSVLDIMKKDGEVANDGGMYALKSRLPIPAPVAEAPKTEEIKPEKPAKKTAKKSAKKTEKAEESAEVKTEEKPVKKTTKKSAKAKKEEVTPTAEAVAEVVPEAVEAPVAEVTEPVETVEEKPVKKTAKKTAKKSVKKEKKTEEIPAEAPAEAPVEAPVEEPAKGVETAVETQEQPQEKTEEKPVVKNPPVVKEKAEIAPKTEVIDMSFLFGSVKPAKVEKTEKIEQKPVEKTEKSVEKTEQKPEAKPQVTAEENSVVLEEKTPEVKTEKPVEKTVKTPVQKVQMPTMKSVQIPAQNRVLKTAKRVEQKPATAEEKLRDNFLKKLRSLGGDYFEYYSVYLLEKYSRKNGRRLESLKISGGERDGGIDGEIELTDRLGFRETIYIQSKNWDPDRGNERLWVVGETLLQQFIGACACKQAKDGKQHARGIFITTSNFTPEAKRVLDMMSDKVVGYDGNDLFDAAKECQFGLIYENGNWKLDEKLLSGTKAFFNM